MHPLIHDWNRAGDQPHRTVLLNDETLRDGLQSPSVRCPSIEQKLEILHLIDRLGIDTADIGLPGAGPHVVRDVERLAREIADAAARGEGQLRGAYGDRRHPPIAEIAQRTGLPIECCTFIGSSPIRQYAEGWTLDELQRLTEEAMRFAVGEGLSVMYVTEDTTRADPETLRPLYSTAIRAGASRVCVADTVGPRHARRRRGRRAIRRGGRGRVRRRRGDRLARPPRPRLRRRQHARGAGRRRDAPARHRDRHRRARRQHADGHAAREPRADGLHRARPVGARRVLRGGVGARPACRSPRTTRSWAAMRSAPRPACTPPPSSRPSGNRTATLVDAVYSGVPAGMVGREQEIDVGPMSGRSNVMFWLEKRGLTASDAAIDRIFAKAKGSRSVLSEQEILREIDDQESGDRRQEAE